MRSSLLTLLGFVLCLPPAYGQTAQERQASVAYVQGCQQPDGGFVPAKGNGTGTGQPRSSLRACPAALRALNYFGGAPHNRQACAEFVERCFDKASGGFADVPGGMADVSTTAIGLLAVVELKLPVDTYREPALAYLAKHVQSFDDIRIAAAAVEAVGARPRTADAWLEQLAKLRHADGTYGSGDGVARATGGAVVAVLRLGGKVASEEHVRQALKNGQRSDGGFGKEGTPSSDLETSYRVLRAFVMLKEKPNVARCQAFVARCRNADGGYGVAPGQPSSVSGTYYASIILHWLE